jgi:hypothetical protein
LSQAFDVEWKLKTIQGPIEQARNFEAAFETRRRLKESGWPKP